MEEQAETPPKQTLWEGLFYKLFAPQPFNAWLGAPSPILMHHAPLHVVMPSTTAVTVAITAAVVRDSEDA